MTNAKGSVALNNYLQGVGRVESLSWVHSTSGPENAPTWTSICKIDGVPLGTGSGPRKYIAMDLAAEETLKALTAEKP
ncbi:hypothetical protein E1B28_001645 [Marasmius oreades]|uniref:DRBM domain-containing protein n=1 Tax=Marasmius oreades TaxID=181124 RepID=A0A9P8AFL9_9AGAR|nr:uncharacterized protein E1B28_001645 [Marasmius oreades]KAG7099837.1 hypothetical protein E1B28_001645 [Marasmius oreades]